LFLQLKNNLAKNPGGLSYRLIQNKGVVWETGTVNLSPDEALKDDATPRDEAAAWLAELLADGPIPSRDIFALAAAKNIAKNTLKRAKQELSVIAYQITNNGQSRWEWKLP
jgi:hypothetical protein